MYFVQDSFFIPIRKSGKHKKKDIQKSSCNNIQKSHIKNLKWYNKAGYGSGDMAGNVVYSFLSSFIMIYLTNIVGLNAGIVGTLIAVSKLFDGVTDIFFGAMIDKTKSRLGKARPWMLYAYIGCAVTLVANFAIPTNMGKFAQYAWFFIAYTLLNAVFFTANNMLMRHL